MNDTLLSFLGICRRAKKLVIGAETTIDSIGSGKSRLVLYAEDVSRNSLKKVFRAAETRGVDALCVRRSKEALSFALGRVSGVLSVEDKGFADKLRELIMNEQGGDLDDKI
ncbi:MAG: ribosomal L7Ae/L30e/S12e/Gadd45 family protein [Ruminococcus sp.]|nr:ribosomal L7Ae/L30e/S12e/Gadd45 family protein [Ruminococcus sp.]